MQNEELKTAPTAQIENDPRLEVLADYAHKAWAAYMDYFLESLPTDFETGARLIDVLYYTNLRRLIDTPYAQLSHSVQELDREEAREILKLLGPL